MRQSMSDAQRREKHEETNKVAASIIQAQRDAQREKSARLRALRLQIEADAAAASENGSVKKPRRH